MTTAIDLFAGLGGFTTGAEAAGIHVLWAANHWRSAVDLHALNHPTTAHACQDLQQADFRDAPEHDVLLASPSCVGHTKARGKDRPSHDTARATAWAVVTAAEVHRPPLVVVENVPEFASWVLFPAWREAMRALGYSIGSAVIDAADHGVPQHRRRFFMAATRTRAPLPVSMLMSGRRRDRIPARSFIDFGSGSWAQIDRPGRAEATLARVAEGRRAHGDRFLVAYYGNERGGRSLESPIGTITTRARHAVIDGDRMRMLTTNEERAAMGFPPDYVLPSDARTATHMLGNAVCPPLVTELLSVLMSAA